jgi:putative heme-binding domain-containing protein
VTGLLHKLLGDRDLQVDAIRGLSAFDDPQTANLLIGRFSALNGLGQQEAMNTLVSRPDSAKVLLAAVAQGRIARHQISPFHLRQLSTMGDAEITRTISTLWPELVQISAEKSARIATYRQQLTPEGLSAANLPQGRALYQRVCASCHVLFGQGSKVGPDLTGAQRSNLNYLLENIVDPSATVSENFRMSIVIGVDGRVINGVITEQNERTITIATPAERIVLPREDVDEVRPSQLSIMPEGQLDVLTADQVRDLIGYLMSPRQVELP